MYKKLQYISQGNTIESQLYNIHQALDNGCKWVQLRFKNQSTKDAFILGEAVKILCEEYLANFIVNDNVYLCQQIAADGVHLGLSDTKIEEARNLLGPTKIIGATANTFQDITNHIKNGCDYIGLGPFQFTQTKDKLSPILGLEGYQEIMHHIRINQIQIPIYAIGGITLENVDPLMETGIYGIAVSGIITNSAEKAKLIKQIKKKLDAKIII